MALDAAALPEVVLAFLAERHLASLTTLRPDGRPHVVAVGFTYDHEQRLVRIITGGASRKVANVRAAGAGARAAVCQIDGPRWLSLEGQASVTDDPDEVAEAVRRYSGRYRVPSDNPTRVALQITVERILGRG